MVPSEDYTQLAQRCTQLAIACSAPSVAGALTVLALDYLAQSHRLGQPSTTQQHQCQIQLDPSVGFGD
jgi:hypothetical protein